MIHSIFTGKLFHADVEGLKSRVTRKKGRGFDGEYECMHACAMKALFRSLVCII